MKVEGVIESIEGNNLYLKGHKDAYFAQESARFHFKEYRAEDGCKLVVPKKGEFSAIFPWTPPEGWKPPVAVVSPPGMSRVGAPVAAGGPGGTPPQGGPGKAEPVPSSEAPGKAQMTFEGVIESISIKVTLNLGNYNNVALEVSANTGDVARAAFRREIAPTITMVREYIKQIEGGKG